ncbi:MAG: endonuclease/exonuclease/phosphatase family protein [Leptolyngbyaceae bacterium]|nr:endonuclease/exonuclease/phosphatase family protein [Leptolyngbyaceae bacterium]
MATFLFWNLNGKALIQEVTQLCDTHSVDVLIVAEIVGTRETAIEAKRRETAIQKSLVSKTGMSYVTEHNDFSKKLKFFFRYPSQSIAKVFDDNGLSIREITPSTGQPILVAAVHLSSKLWSGSEDQTYVARSVIKGIEESEENVSHSRTLVIGDFNMNPFEGGLIDADAFHGVMTQQIAQEKSRKVHGLERSYFYNPMWGRMGDISDGPPGTYYYRGSTSRQFFWNTFDQVLLRPDLLRFFKKENLKVITEIDNFKLIKSSKINKDDFSDHLPILIELS